MLLVSTNVLSNEVSSKPLSVGPGAAIGDVALGLIFVSAMIIVLGWAVKKLSGNHFIQQNGMKVIASLSLSSREKIVLVEVGSQKLLLGVAPGSITRLHVLDEMEYPAEHDGSSVPKAENTSEEKWDFSKYLKNIINDGLQK